MSVADLAAPPRTARSRFGGTLYPDCPVECPVSRHGEAQTGQLLNSATSSRAARPQLPAVPPGLHGGPPFACNRPTRAGCFRIAPPTQHVQRPCFVVLVVLPLVLSVAAVSSGQSLQHCDSGATPDQPHADESGGQDKRIFGIIPNYRTSPTLKDYSPLSLREKFKIAADDASDRGTLALAALFAGDGQLTDATPSFGHGIGGYSRYYAASLADLVIGDFMTEGMFPVALRQDPRYFRRGTGSGW
jgi:hypothetical protein